MNNEKQDSTTLDGSQRHRENRKTNPGDVCPKCGALLEDGQMFCAKCGEPRSTASKDVCGKCGAELQAGQDFCPKCGQKAGAVAGISAGSTAAQSDVGASRANDAKKRKPLKFIIAAAAAVAVIIAVVIAVPKMFVSIDELCARGNYEKAYEKASGTEKNDILAENMIAYLSAETGDKLKDPSSFSLRDAYYCLCYDEDEDRILQQAVLYLSGKNSFGTSVSSYWVWVAEDNGEWFLGGTCSSLDLTSDDDEEEYIISVVGKSIVEDKNTIKLSKSSVKNINNHFENDILDQIVPIENEKLDTSVMPKQ